MPRRGIAGATLSNCGSFSSNVIRVTSASALAVAASGTAFAAVATCPCADGDTASARTDATDDKSRPPIRAMPHLPRIRAITARLFLISLPFQEELVTSIYNGVFFSIENNSSPDGAIDGIDT